MVLPVNFEIEEHKKLVMIGESGSGKTELALRICCQLRDHSDATVYILDMDQTKPMFRSRDVADFLREKGVLFPIEKQFMDAPVVPHGVKTILSDRESYTVLDVGGNKAGALCLGQYAQELLEADAAVFYTINPYRCFSNSADHIRETMEMVLSCCSLREIRIVGNPYIGPETTPEDFCWGLERLKQMLDELGLKMYAALVPDHLAGQEAIALSLPKRYMTISPFMPGTVDL